MRDRFDIENRLRGETLVRKGLMNKHAKVERLRLVPELNVVKIGGHGIIDFVREVMIINGHKRGLLERALKGENVGTLIRA